MLCLHNTILYSQITVYGEIRFGDGMKFRYREPTKVLLWEKTLNGEKPNPLNVKKVNKKEKYDKPPGTEIVFEIPNSVYSRSIKSPFQRILKLNCQFQYESIYKGEYDKTTMVLNVDLLQGHLNDKTIRIEDAITLNAPERLTLTMLIKDIKEDLDSMDIYEKGLFVAKNRVDKYYDEYLLGKRMDMSSKTTFYKLFDYINYYIEKESFFNTEAKLLNERINYINNFLDDTVKSSVIPIDERVLLEEELLISKKVYGAYTEIYLLLEQYYNKLQMLLFENEYKDIDRLKSDFKDSNILKLNIDSLQNKSPFLLYEVGRSDLNNINKSLSHKNVIVDINSTLLLRKNKNFPLSSLYVEKMIDSNLISSYEKLISSKILIHRQIEARLIGIDDESSTLDRLAFLEDTIDMFLNISLYDSLLRNEFNKARTIFKSEINVLDKLNQFNDSENYLYFEYIDGLLNDEIENIKSDINVKITVDLYLRGSGYEETPSYLTRQFELLKVPRWIINLPDILKNKILSTARLSDTLGYVRTNNLKRLKALYANIASSSTCISTITNKIDSLRIIAISIKDQQQADYLLSLEYILQELDLLQYQLVEISRKAQNVNNIIQLKEVHLHFSQYDTLMKLLLVKIPDYLRQGTNDLNRLNLIAQITSICDSCLMRLTLQTRRLKTLYTVLEFAISDLEGSNRFNKNITEKATQLSSSISKDWEEYIDLTSIYPRKNGDNLFLNSYLEVEFGENVIERIMLGNQAITLILAGFYSKTGVGFIFANPTPDIDNQKREYFFAPSYSLLLHRGSRKSNFYNKFINFGFGLNFSAPDFDLDGVPEFSSGIEFTAFQDIVSFGFGYNFGVETPFMLFGIRFPLFSSRSTLQSN